MDLNKKFRIAKFKIESTTISVYLLNPGEWFQGFGGSRHSLEVKKTASLIVRTEQHGLEDVEHNLRGKEGQNLWSWIFDTFKKSTPIDD